MSHTKKFSQIELKHFLTNTSSIIKVLGNGKVIWRKQVILDGKGDPVPLELFHQVVSSPEKLVMRDNISHERFEKTPKERKLLKAFKSDYNQGMKALFNGDEDWRKTSRAMMIHNVPDDSKVIKEIQQQL